MTVDFLASMQYSWIKDVKVGSVKKFVKKVSNVENVVEKNVTYQMEDNKD